MKTLSKSVSPLVRQFKQCFYGGIEVWKKAGQHVARLVDKEDVSVDEIAELCGDEFSSELINMFLRVGRGELLTELLAASWPAATRLRRLPVSVQRAALEGVPVVTSIRKRLANVKLRAPELTTAQAQQVFDGRRIRPIEEQVTFLKIRRAREIKMKRAAAQGVTLQYQIVGNRVYVSKACFMTKGDLKKMLRDLEFEGNN